MKKYFNLIVTDGDQQKKAEKWCKKHNIICTANEAWLQVTSDVFCKTISLVATEEDFEKLVKKMDGSRIY